MNEPKSEKTIIAKGKNANHWLVQIIHCTPGWEIAGAGQRYHESETWLTRTLIQGCSHGQHFGTLEEAVKLFDQRVIT